MIQANELRLGNWLIEYGIDYVMDNKIIDKNDISYVQVNIEVLSKIFNYEDDAVLYEPIPLTPEILEKCGFVGQSSGWYFIEYFTDCMEAAEKCGITINSITGRCLVFQDDEEEGSDGAYLKYSVKYLHDLQNLYYALTKQELNYTP